RQIEPALAGDQEFASDRTHAIEQTHLHTCGARGFGRHQPRRAAADDRHATLRSIHVVLSVVVNRADTRISMPTTSSLPMKIVLSGATGHIGHAILDEALRRGDEVTAVVRDPERVGVRNPKLTVVKGDAADPATYTAVLRGADAVIASLSARKDKDFASVARNASTLLDALSKAGVKRFAWVGGAGTLE